MFIPRLRLIALSALAAASALAAVSLDRSARDTAGDDNSFINQCGHKLGDHHLEAEESTGKWYLHAVCEGAEDGSAHCSELDLDTYVPTPLSYVHGPFFSFRASPTGMLCPNRLAPSSSDSLPYCSIPQPRDARSLIIAQIHETHIRCLENSDGYLRETEGGNFSKTCDKCSLQTDAGGYSVAILCECDPIAPETTLLRIGRSSWL